MVGQGQIVWVSLSWSVHGGGLSRVVWLCLSGRVIWPESVSLGWSVGVGCMWLLRVGWLGSITWSVSVAQSVLFSLGQSVSVSQSRSVGQV